MINSEELGDRAEALYDTWIVNVRHLFPRTASDQTMTEARLSEKLDELGGKLAELDAVIDANRGVAATAATSELASHDATERTDRASAARIFLAVEVLGSAAFTIVAIGAFFIWPTGYDDSCERQ